MSARRDVFYDRRRRNGTYPAAAAVGCPSCGFSALVVSTDPDATDAGILDDLIASDCFGCPKCWHDLDLFLRADTGRCAGTLG